MAQKFKKGDWVVLKEGKDMPRMLVIGYIKETHWGPPIRTFESDTEVEVTWNEGTSVKKAHYNQELLRID